jgi:hypothetical protein
LFGVAVKVTEVPAHTGLADGAMATLTGKTGFTVMVTELEVAGLPVEQARVEVMTTYTTSPLTGV